MSGGRHTKGQRFESTVLLEGTFRCAVVQRATEALETKKSLCLIYYLYIKKKCWHKRQAQTNNATRKRDKRPLGKPTGEKTSPIHVCIYNRLQTGQSSVLTGWVSEKNSAHTPEVLPGGRQGLGGRHRVAGPWNVRRREGAHVGRGGQPLLRVEVAPVGQVVGDGAAPDEALQQGRGREAVGAVEPGAGHLPCARRINYRHTQAEDTMMRCGAVVRCLRRWCRRENQLVEIFN